MFAVGAAAIDEHRPLDALRVGEWPEPRPPEDCDPGGWTTVDVVAAGLNHHDLWTLRGVGITRDRLPVILGAEAAGTDETGRPVIVYPVVGDLVAGRGDETLDPRWAMLSTEYDGTFAERVAVPRRNLLPKPPELSFEQAACLPGAWLTAYRMLFERSGLSPGQTVLVQGVGGGVATALIRMGAAAGFRVWVTGRSAARRRRALRLGAERAFEQHARLPERVDAVMETVGKATWEHSVNAVRHGGRIVVCGATTGRFVTADLARVFFRQLSVVGSTLGTMNQLEQLAQFCVNTGLRPELDRVLPLARAVEGFSAMADGSLFGKVVFRL